MLYNSVKGGLAISCFRKDVGCPKGSTLRAPGARGSWAQSLLWLDRFQAGPSGLDWILLALAFSPKALWAEKAEVSTPLPALGCLCSSSKTSLSPCSTLRCLVGLEVL